MKCEYCEKEIIISYGSGRFCSKQCARGFSTKKKRKEINEKVSKTLTKNKTISKECPICKIQFETKKRICCSKKCGSIYGGKNVHKGNGRIKHIIDIECKECKKIFTMNWNKRNQKFCSRICRDKNLEWKKLISDTSIKRCSSLIERKRLRDIGRKGGFGKKGYTKNGTRFDSMLEKACFDWLEINRIEFEEHKPIPNSSKVSDIYIPINNVWIEIDGINREKKRKWLKDDYQYWLDKLEIYKYQKLNYRIIYSLKDLEQIFK